MIGIDAVEWSMDYDDWWLVIIRSIQQVDFYSDSVITIVKGIEFLDAYKRADGREREMKQALRTNQNQKSVESS